tara:strand:- start:59 stop:862 length:804 start_codon:yes stop_codon:yes gene_type:complete
MPFTNKTVLHEAAEEGNVNLLTLLLKAGADADVTRSPDSETPLIAAAVHGSTQATKLLLLFGADPNLADTRGDVAIITAAEDGRIRMLELLIKHGADVNSRCTLGTTALTTAAREGRARIVKRLLSAGADVNLPGEHSRKALQLARMRHCGDMSYRRPDVSCEGNFEEVIALLLAAGADPYELPKDTRLDTEMQRATYRSVVLERAAQLGEVMASAPPGVKEKMMDVHKQSASAHLGKYHSGLEDFEDIVDRVILSPSGAVAAGPEA